MMPQHPDRELAFRVRLQLTQGSLKHGEQAVGQVTGHVIVPIRAFYRFHPPPGQYLFTPPDRGSLVAIGGGGQEVVNEVVVATMGHLDLATLVPLLDLPDRWSVIPAELLSSIVLEAELEYEDVDADDEYKANEPDDLEEARQRFQGKWRLIIEMPLGESIPRTEPVLSLDRWEFEVDARFARLEDLT